MLIWFLREYGGYKAEAWQHEGVTGFDTGRESFVSESFGELSEREKEALSCAVRLWPHKVKGEGHFAVRLRKPKTSIKNIDNTVKTNKIKNCSISRKELKELQNFAEEIFINSNIEKYVKRLRFLVITCFLFQSR